MSYKLFLLRNFPTSKCCGEMFYFCFQMTRGIFSYSLRASRRQCWDLSDSWFLVCGRALTLFFISFCRWCSFVGHWLMHVTQCLGKSLTNGQASLVFLATDRLVPCSPHPSPAQCHKVTGKGKRQSKLSPLFPHQIHHDVAALRKACHAVKKRRKNNLHVLCYLCFLPP